MRKGKRKLLFCLAGGLSFVLAACGSEEPDLSTVPLAELQERAAEEKIVGSLAMPDTWANWGQTWAELEERWGLFHQDLDMSSAEEVEFFRFQQENGATRDIGDVGLSYAAQAEKEGLLLKYRTSYWDEIPEWAKDDDGDWIISYTGSTSFLINAGKVDEPPSSWQEVRDGSYSVTVGDVLSSVQSQYAVIASAYAFGGGADNLEPGIQFWKELALAGRLDKVYTKPERIIGGEIELVVLTDFNSLNYRSQALERNPNLSMEVVIPRDGAISLGYATIISKEAPHPYAAALAREYILSDQGQINLARGFARPVREVELPAEVREQMLPDEEYAKVIHIDGEENIDVEKLLQETAKAWRQEILPLLQ